MRVSTGPASSAFRFTGQPLDPSTSLYYLRARSDDPAVGRFLSRDPFPGLAILPASQHAYAYARNDPANLLDPSGECAGPLVLACAAVAGAIAGGAAYTLTHQDEWNAAEFAEWSAVGATAGMMALGTAVAVAEVALPACGTALLTYLAVNASAKLASDPSIAIKVLSKGERIAAQTYPGVARMQWGNAVERLVTGAIEKSPLLRRLFQHVGGPGQPDYRGQGLLQGLKFEVTTRGQVTAHLTRPYGAGLNVATYEIPNGPILFP